MWTVACNCESFKGSFRAHCSLYAQLQTADHMFFFPGWLFISILGCYPYPTPTRTDWDVRQRNKKRHHMQICFQLSLAYRVLSVSCGCTAESVCFFGIGGRMKMTAGWRNILHDTYNPPTTPPQKKKTTLRDMLKICSCHESLIQFQPDHSCYLLLLNKP